MFGFSTTTATAPLSTPVSFSPTMRSVLLPDGPEYAPRVRLGRSGSVASSDSKIPIMSTTSGTFKEIFLS